MSDWISVEDRLPETNKAYLCFLDTGFVCMGFFGKNKQWIKMWGATLLFVTHWQLLPPPPE